MVCHKCVVYTSHSTHALKHPQHPLLHTHIYTCIHVLLQWNLHTDGMLFNPRITILECMYVAIWWLNHTVCTDISILNICQRPHSRPTPPSNIHTHGIYVEVSSSSPEEYFAPHILPMPIVLSKVLTEEKFFVPLSVAMEMVNVMEEWDQSVGPVLQCYHLHYPPQPITFKDMY